MNASAHMLNRIPMGALDGNDGLSLPRQQKDVRVSAYATNELCVNHWKKSNVIPYVTLEQ